MAQTRLNVGSFGGASAFPIVVARELGLFARQDLHVERLVTSDLGRLREGLTSGDLDIVHAAPDNVIAWFDDGLEVAAWLAGSNGPISLVAGSASNVVGLAGSCIGVDSPRSGFVPILRRILDMGGVAADSVELVSLGATRQRFVALSESAIDATMLTLPWSHLATKGGATVLADHTRVAPGLLTSCALSLRSWLDGQAAIAAAYADAIDAAVSWLHEPANRERAATLLADDVGLDPAVAESVLDTMLAEPGGWPAYGRLSGPELDPTWELRSDAMGRPHHVPGEYVWAVPPKRSA